MPPVSFPVPNVSGAGENTNAFTGSRVPGQKFFRGIYEYFSALLARFDEARALRANRRIASRNSRADHSRLKLLRKTVPGHGLVLAHAAAWGLDSTIQRGIIAPPDPPAVGATPPKLRPYILDYEYPDILNMIIFYNNDFGVTPGEPQQVWVKKFCDFLSRS